LWHEGPSVVVASVVLAADMYPHKLELFRLAAGTALAAAAAAAAAAMVAVVLQFLQVLQMLVLL
jgi:hypothetical protein